MIKKKEALITSCIIILFLTLSLLTSAIAQEEPSSRCGLVTLDEKDLTLAGKELKVGNKAPGFELLDVDSKPVSDEAFKGKIKIISVMPSIDTPT